LETGAPFPDAPEQAQQSILRRWQNEIRFRKLPLPTLTQIQRETETSPLDIQTVLQGWAMASPLPLVVFLDEIDSLEDQTLISILRQLRAG
ncbi:ATP-binding protein, partial [Cylindrospermopsis raciborskii CS-506_B]|nr:ATP-binding protein [Cylindrospermopsis raciborskii CS-506_B]